MNQSTKNKLALGEVGALEHVYSGRVFQRRWWLPGWDIRGYTQDKIQMSKGIINTSILGYIKTRIEIGLENNLLYKKNWKM